MDQMKRDVPKFLYHYTTIETLALILKNRTIRLNSLANVDDLNEGHNDSNPQLKANQFVSCWTDDSDEIIPLWTMYSHDMKGVRIKLPSNFHPRIEAEITGQCNLGDWIDDVGKIVWSKYGSMLFQVEYVDKHEDLIVNAVKSSKKPTDYTNYNYSEIGKRKLRCWEFQREWRYKLFCFNGSKEPNTFFASDFFSEESHLSVISNVYDPVENEARFVDIRIDDEKFSKMEVTLGPRVTSGQMIIVEDLLEKYNPEAALHPSSLEIR